MQSIGLSSLCMTLSVVHQVASRKFEQHRVMSPNSSNMASPNGDLSVSVDGSTLDGGPSATIIENNSSSVSSISEASETNGKAKATTKKKPKSRKALAQQEYLAACKEEIDNADTIAKQAVKEKEALGKELTKA